MRGIRKAFRATIALDGVDLAVAGGEICGLIGQNGAGKSTLMGILAGRADARRGRHVRSTDALCAAQPDRGAAGRRRDDLPGALARAAPQRDGEHSARCRTDALRARRSARACARPRVRALAELGHDDIRPTRSVGTLSVAAQQLVEIARALAVGCRVLVLDEPTSSLGRDDVRRLFDLLRRLKAQGHAIVYISHFIEEVKEVADRFVVLRDGRNAGGGATAEATHGEIVELMVGGEIVDLFPRTPRSAGDAAARAGRARTGSGDLHAASRRDPRHRGADRIGPHAAAPDDLRARARQGGTRPRRRRRRTGEPARALAAGRRACSARIARTKGWRSGLDVGDNLTMTRMEPFGRAGLVLPARQDQAARRWIERSTSSARARTAGIGTVGRQPAEDRDGEAAPPRRRCAACSTSRRAAIDVGSKAQIYRLDRCARRRRQRRGRRKAVLMVSSYLPELLGLCDRIAVMRRGRLSPPCRPDR